MSKPVSDLSFDCKTNKKIVPKPPKQEVVEEAKPRPKRSYSGPKRSGVRRKATVEVNLNFYSSMPKVSML